MWAEFNYSKYPEIIIDFSGTINNDDEFENFINEWREINNCKKKYTLFFNTKNCKLVNIKYAYKMAKFIKELKKDNIKYLGKSTIVIYNYWIVNLMKLIVKIEKPIAPLKLVYIDTNKLITVTNL